MNGLDYVSRVRAMETGERFLPIIMISGILRHVPPSRSRRDRGVTEFLRKPVTTATSWMRLEAVIMRPRAFVTTEAYFGPDRRRKRQTAYLGKRRRQSDRKELVEL
jgi:FixJ family two-component response regulator